MREFQILRGMGPGCIKYSPIIRVWKSSVGGLFASPRTGEGSGAGGAVVLVANYYNTAIGATLSVENITPFDLGGSQRRY